MPIPVLEVPESIQIKYVPGISTEKNIRFEEVFQEIGVKGVDAFLKNEFVTQDGDTFPKDSISISPSHIDSFSNSQYYQDFTVQVSPSIEDDRVYNGIIKFEAETPSGVILHRTTVVSLVPQIGETEVFFYPNPFNPTTDIGKFRFNNFDNPNKVRIFDVSNVLVRQLECNEDDIEIIWDGKNGKGDIVANGTYLYVVESSSGEKGIGKVSVLR
jgi:hypothetical protein